jgi:cyd operon protein YbgT
MWYFSWMLGVGFAASLAIINVMWLEINVMSDEADDVQQDNND